MTPESRFVVSAVTRKVHVFNRQDSRQVSDELRGSLEIWGDSFLGLLEEHYPARVKLPDLVNVSLIDDAEIQRVHTQFMDSPVPTDVITFPYGEEGEILISIETASRKADELESGAAGHLGRREESGWLGRDPDPRPTALWARRLGAGARRAEGRKFC